MKRSKINVIGRFYVITLFMLCVMLLTACSRESTVDVDPTIGEEQETRTSVQVTMPDYKFTYSGMMADLITVNELENSNHLEFSVKIEQEEFAIFLLHFNAEEGDLVEFLTASNGDKVPVAFEMMPLPEGLQEDDALVFYLAQESVNDVIASIKLK